MKRRLFSAVAVLFIAAFFGASVRGGDFGLDPSFAPVFEFADSDVENSISDVFVQADQKIMVGGNFYSVNGQPVRYLVRLNPDGSRDTTFTAALQETPTGRVLSVVQLANGQYFITGRFQVGFTFPYYLRLNADGSIDSSFSVASIGSKIVPLPDGRFMVCGSRLINDQTYWISHRLLADGTPDPSFRITSAIGSCLDLAMQTDGKVIVSASFQNPNNSYQERVQRFNTDGSRDMTFSGHNYDSIARKIELLPNGKVMAAYDFVSGQNNYSKIFRLNSDGSLDREFPNCGMNSSTTTGFLPLEDDSVMMSGCKKWTTGPVYQFSRTRTDGSIQPDLNNLSVAGNIKEIESAGNGKFYAYGLFSQINGVNRSRIARLQPYTAPIKTKFDFDGDRRSDLTVFRPSGRYWYVNQSSAGAFYFLWGLATDKPFASDFDNDGKYDVAMVRDSIWYLLTSATGYSYDYFQLGTGPGKPLGGDFNGDGKADSAMRRINQFGVNWNLMLNGQRGLNIMTETIPGESVDGIPFVGDLDGDGRDEIGTFDRGNWKTRDYAPGAPTVDFRWGIAGDIPTPADYDGDGITDYAIYRPSRGEWWINRSRDGFYAVTFGLDGDVPVPADYDGDGKTDIAIFRNGEWWQILSATETVVAQQWGIAGDIAIPAQ